MAETTGSAAASPAPAGTGVSAGTDGAVGSSVPASADSGLTPGVGGDAQASEGAVATPPAQAAAKWRFLDREFDDQATAEKILKGELFAKRGLQKQNADLQKRIAALESQVQSGGVGGRVAPQGPNGSSEPPLAFADQLAKSGELELFAKIAQDESMGPGHMAYAMAQAFDKHYSEQLQSMREEMRSELGQFTARGEFEKTLARTMTAAKALVSEFPELDDSIQTEDAEDWRDAVLEKIQSTPQVTALINGQPQQVAQGALWLAKDPASALRWAASEVRRERGTPVFAQPPGTSGSPSARAAMAAEKAAAATAGESLDGTGTPRPRPGGEPKTLAEMWRRDREKARREVTTPSGRNLGFTEGP